MVGWCSGGVQTPHRSELDLMNHPGVPTPPLVQESIHFGKVFQDFVTSGKTFLDKEYFPEWHFGKVLLKSGTRGNTFFDKIWKVTLLESISDHRFEALSLVSQRFL